MQTDGHATDGEAKKIEVSLLRDIFDSVPAAIFIVDKSGWILDCNKTAGIKTCMTRDALLKERIFMLSAEKKVTNFTNSLKVLHKMDIIKVFAELLDDPSPRQLKVPLTTPSNEKIWYTFTITRHLNNGKDLFMIHAIETLEQCEVLDKVEMSEQKYRQMFDTQALPVMLFNNKMRVVDCSFAVERMFGYPMGELVGLQFTDLPFLKKEQGDLLLDNYRRLLADNPVELLSIEVHTKAGAPIWVELRASILPLGKSTFVQVIAQDVTEKIKIKQLLEEENKRLKDLDMMRKSFITSATHEIKTPLTSIDGASSFLASRYHDLDDARRLELVRLVRRGSSRLRALTEALLDFSGVEGKEMTLSLAPVLLLEIIKDAMSSVSFLIEQRRHRLDVLVDSTVTVLADKTRLEQVLANLISNAAKNTPPSGFIEISAIVSNNTAIVAVKDSGVGIEPDEQSKLFQKFGKIERAGLRADIDIQGPGIGLYLSREIISLHGGMTWVESAGRGKGATFKFTVPLASGQALAPSPGQKKPGCE